MVDSESGRLAISGYKAGASEQEAKKRGVFAPLVASADPTDAYLFESRQMTLIDNEKSSVEIAYITMCTGLRGIYYVANRSNEDTGQFHLEVGSFGLPAGWKK